MSCRICNRAPLRARGLCHPCYRVLHYRGELGSYPTLVDRRSAAHLLSDYELLRSEGHSARQIAGRLGMTFAAFDGALRRAKRRGDSRALDYTQREFQ